MKNEDDNHPNAMPYLGEGTRVYEGFSAATKIQLTDYLDRQLAQPIAENDSSLSWESELGRMIDDVLERRAQSGEILELGSVVEEVLPLAKAKIPKEVREELFRKIIVAVKDEYNP